MDLKTCENWKKRILEPVLVLVSRMIQKCPRIIGLISKVIKNAKNEPVVSTNVLRDPAREHS